MIKFILGFLIGRTLNKETASSHTPTDTEVYVGVAIFAFLFILVIIYNIYWLIKDIKEEKQRKKEK